jgi:hypothetical protein
MTPAEGVIGCSADWCRSVRGAERSIQTAAICHLHDGLTQTLERTRRQSLVSFKIQVFWILTPGGWGKHLLTFRRTVTPYSVSSSPRGEEHYDSPKRRFLVTSQRGTPTQKAWVINHSMKPFILDAFRWNKAHRRTWNKRGNVCTTKSMQACWILAP